MTPKSSPLGLLPVGSILDRYLLRGFLRIFALSMISMTTLYLIVDFFDRIDNLMRANAPLWIAFEYFLFKLPLFSSRVFAFAALFSTLFCLGIMSRTHEVTAMRSSGLSLRRISLPLLVGSVLIGFLSFFWNEALVPIFTRKSQQIYKTEVKKNQPRGILGSQDIWIRGQDAFISVDYFDSQRSALEGVSIYLLDRDFSLKGLIEAPSARWNGTQWEPRGAREWLFLSNGRMTQRPVKSPLPIQETPEDFRLLAHLPEEFSFFELRGYIADLRSKGIDATQYDVDLQLKLALPLVCPLLVFLAIPFAVRQGRGGGMALSFGITMLVGFGYYLVLSLGVSLGHSGALPPLVAAWLANVTLTLLALFFSVSEQ